MFEVLSKIIMNLAFLSGLLTHPPEDLMSLASSESVLACWKQDASPAALVALLEGRAAGAPKSGFDPAAVQGQLAKGGPRERREARAKIAAATESDRGGLAELAADPDPEVAVPAKERLAQLDAAKAELAARKERHEEPDLRPWAARRLGELKHAAARPLLERLAKSEGGTLGRECTRALALLDGRKIENSAALEPSALVKGLDADPMILAVAELRRGATAQTLEARVAALPAGSVPQLNAEIKEQIARGISLAVDQVGNVEIHSLAFSMPADFLSDRGDNEEHASLRVLASGWFDAEKIGLLLRQNKRRDPVELAGLTFHRPDSDVALHCSENLVAWVVATRNDIESVAGDVAARLGNPAAKLPPHAAEVLAKIASGQARAAAWGSLNERIRNETLKEVAQNKQRALRDPQDPESKMLPFFTFCETVLQAKSFEIALNKNLSLGGHLETADAEAAKTAVTGLADADASLRQFFKDALNRNAPAPVKSVFAAVNLEKAWSSGKTEGAKLLFTIEDDLLRLFPGIFVAETSR
ncbi:MAG: hypothetical protein RL095_2858 [Verrucomicrobiota bacterium]